MSQCGTLARRRGVVYAAFRGEAAAGGRRVFSGAVLALAVVILLSGSLRRLLPLPSSSAAPSRWRPSVGRGGQRIHEPHLRR